MNTLSTTLVPDADGTLHLPVPPAWRNFIIRVKVEMEPVTLQVISDEKRRRALAALQRIAARGGIAGIENPSAWQREQRADRTLAGRES